MLLAVSNFFLYQHSFTLQKHIATIYIYIYFFSLFFFSLFLFVAYCLLEAISHNVMRQCNKQPTHELYRFRSDIPLFVSEHRRLFNFCRGQLRMASNVTRNQHIITRGIFDLPCALNFVAVSSSFIMSLNYLGVRIKYCCLRIYGELVSRLRIQFPIFQKMFDSIEERSSVQCS